MGIVDKWLLRNILQEQALYFFQETYFQPLAQAVSPVPSISIVTTAMDRLSDIKQTLPRNMEDNKSADFVLLDYNSRDGLSEWIQSNMREQIESGRLSFYRTTEPKYYSMAHSRNIAFKLAKGDIINNVDADNFTTPGFDEKLKELATGCDRKVIFVKSRQKKRGRIGIYADEFIKLGGYNEQLIEYGFDDSDLIYRATRQGFRMVIFGGEYYKGVEDHGRHIDGNYQYEWRYTERLNTLVSLLNIAMGKLEANKGKPWGKAHLLKNFREWIDV